MPPDQRVIGRRTQDLPADAPVLSGEVAFRLYDTYGFPLDLTVELAAESGVRVDEEGYRAALEAQRILGYLPDPMDRQIMVLRALDHQRWDDIAKLCGKTERTMRLRYEKAVVRLRQCIEAETAAFAR